MPTDITPEHASYLITTSLHSIEELLLENRWRVERLAHGADQVRITSFRDKAKDIIKQAQEIVNTCDSLLPRKKSKGPGDCVIRIMENESKTDTALIFAQISKPHDNTRQGVATRLAALYPQSRGYLVSVGGHHVAVCRMNETAVYTRFLLVTGKGPDWE